MSRELLFQVYQHPLFTQADLEEIALAHQLEMHAKGEILLKESQIAKEYYLVQEGLVRTYVYDYDGNDITTGFVGENQVLIEVASIFTQTPTKENIQCLTNTKLWKITYDDFQGLFHKIPAMREWGRAWLSMELFRNKTRATEMITLPATQRYLQLMSENPQIIQQAPLKNIASYLGITDTSLSRIRKSVAAYKSF
jgi:CRP-like cAMP-binding protein